MDFFIFGMHIHLDKRILFLLIVVGIVSISGLGFFMSKGEGAIIIDKTAETPLNKPVATMSDKSSSEQSQNEEKIKVYVVGCVNNPGIIEITKGQIISDAIKKAGGPTSSADIFNINMVYKLTENVMLKINNKNPVKKTESETQAENSEAGKGVEIVRETGNALINGSEGNSKKGGLININTATAEELDVLPGVGEKTAADIIAYREKSGGFRKIEEMMNVSRIGQKRFDTLKPLITV